MTSEKPLPVPAPPCPALLIDNPNTFPRAQAQTERKQLCARVSFGRVADLEGRSPKQELTRPSRARGGKTKQTQSQAKAKIYAQNKRGEALPNF